MPGPRISFLFPRLPTLFPIFSPRSLFFPPGMAVCSNCLFLPAISLLLFFQPRIHNAAVLFFSFFAFHPRRKTSTSSRWYALGTLGYRFLSLPDLTAFRMVSVEQPHREATSRIVRHLTKLKRRRPSTSSSKADNRDSKFASMIEILTNYPVVALGDLCLPDHSR